VNGQVIRRPRAQRDLDEIASYLQQDSPNVAIRFLERAEETFALLASMPRMGRRYLSEHARLQDLRVWSVSGFDSYRIFYRPIDGGIEVVRVLHGARDIASVLEAEEVD
jgi:toxin ParE1/3/4